MAMTIWLVVQGMVFAAWAMIAFRTLFRLLTIIQRLSGRSVPGFLVLLNAPAIFLRDPVFASDRRLLLFLTIALLVLSAGFAALR